MDSLICQSNEDHDQQKPPIAVVLSIPIILTDQIHQSVDESKLYELECANVGKQVHRLSQLLRFFVYFADSTTLYERPVRRIYSDVIINLNHAINLIRKCRHYGFIHRLISIINIDVTDFVKVFNLLELSIGDLKWLINVFDFENKGNNNNIIILTLPSIASNNTILALVWFYIALLHKRSFNLKIKSAIELSTLARDNDRNKMIIVEEGGIAPLLKLLNHEYEPETQIAGAMALFNLANDQTTVRSIYNEFGILVLSDALQNSHTSVQIEVAKLIARMVNLDTVCQEGFARKDVIETIVILLLKNLRKTDESKLILELNINCCGLLWMLARGNVVNCIKLTETNSLDCLAKLMEKENRELKINCLMTIIEITSLSECNFDIRRLTFKTNSPDAKATVDQLLRLIDQSDDHVIKILSIRAIGQLARTFPAKETRVISHLVKQLGDVNQDVVNESVIALGKFICFENYLRVEHSKTIVELVGKCVGCKYFDLRDLVAEAVHHLNLSKFVNIHFDRHCKFVNPR